MDSRHSLLRVVTQQLHWGGALRDDPKNGYEGRDSKVREILEGARKFATLLFARHFPRTWQFSLAFNLVPRALFPGFGGSKTREKRPGDEVDSRLDVSCAQLSVTKIRDYSRPGYWKWKGS